MANSLRKSRQVLWSLEEDEELERAVWHKNSPRKPLIMFSLGSLQLKAFQLLIKGKNFAQQLQRELKIPLPRADDWGDLFWHLAQQSQKRKIILILDEISWMGSKDPTFLGKLKTAWDLYFKNNPQLVLILCGSISSWIEENILSSTGFMGRISLDIVLEELPLYECLELRAR